MNENRYPLLAVSRLRMETDGEGVTTLIAGAGCSLKCRYCINAKLLQKEPEYVSASELYDRVKIDSLYFLATGGGVTFGGGESLLHARFISKFRAICGEGWRLYAETSLNVPEESVRIAAQCIDGFIVDIKTASPLIYEAYTGKPSEPAFRNLRLLLALVGPERIRVRVPLIPNYNTPEDCDAAERVLLEMGITRIERFDYVVREA